MSDEMAQHGERYQQKWSRATRVAPALCGLLVGLMACSSTQLQPGQCRTDSQCAVGFQCVDSHCICKSDQACPTGQRCNEAGFCQARIGCQTSLDCPKGQFCDTTSGNCLDQTHCTADIQCPLGQVCDTVRFQCVPGCREVGDCPLGNVCQCPAGQTCPPGAILSCIQGPCGDDSYCQYGQQCLEETDGGPKRCVTDNRGPFCQPCTINAGQEPCAGSTPNFCLVDTSKTFNADFCGVDCSQGQSCPWGFECDDVLILTEQTCGSTGMQCPLRPNPTCNSDADCANQRGGACNTSTHQCVCVSDADCPGGVCDTASGQCQGKCEVGEGQQQGFCTCLENSDCPTDTCNSFDQRCTISLKPCDPAVPNSCAPIFCKKVADPQSQAITGYCYIGQNCAPKNGITCDMVQNSQ